MSGPLVSICVTTRGRLELLRASLAGILAQDYAPLEIMISDNWSDDGTREHCMALAAADPRVRYERPSEPLGLYANHNFALRQTRGAYVSFFHDDDLYRPTIISRYVAFLEAHPTAGVVCSDWDRVDASGAVLERRRNDLADLTRGIDYIERTLPAGRTAVALSGAMSRREALGPDPFDEDGPLGFSDIVTWFRIAESYDVGYIREQLWSYRSHSGAYSHRPASAIASDYARAFGAYCDEYLTRHPSEERHVIRWRAAIQRYRFWALFYETAARLAEPRSETFDRSGAFGDLRSSARLPVEAVSVAALRLLAGTGKRWPFALLVRHSAAGRRLIRLR